MNDNNNQQQLQNQTLTAINKIEISCKSSSLVWNKSAYREDVLEGILEKEEFETILDYSSKIMGEAMIKKRENDNINLPKYLNILSYVSISFSIFYAIFLYLATTTSNSEILLFVSFSFLVLGTLIAFVISIVNYKREIRKFKTLETFIKDDLDSYLYQINSTYTGKLEFKYIPSKEPIIELSIFVKTPKMIEEEMQENNKGQNEKDSNVDDEDFSHHSEIDKSINRLVDVKDEGKNSKNLKPVEIEMGNTPSDSKKKLGKFVKKKN